MLLAVVVLWVYNFNNTPALLTWRGIQLPPTVLPVLLLILSEILPSSSFWCNFCGLALGYGYVQGLLERMQLSLHAVRMVEAWPFIRQTTTWSGFVDSPEANSLPTTGSDAERGRDNEDHPKPSAQASHAPAAHIEAPRAEYESTTAL